MEKLMNFKSTASMALTLAAALALSACDTAPQQGNRDAAAQSAANAARAQQEADAKAKAEQAEADRKKQIASANASARITKFVPQSYATWVGGASNLTLHLQRNGKAIWEEPVENGKPYTMDGTWRLQKGQVVVRLNNKQDKKVETFVFLPKTALIAADAADASCKALSGLMPVSANGQTENLDKIYLWSKAQLEKNQGSCING